MFNNNPLICVKHLRKLHVICAHSLLHAYFNTFPEVEFSPSSVDLLIRIQTKSCFFLPYYLSHTKMLFLLLVFIASSILGSQGITRWHGVRTHNCTVLLQLFSIVCVFTLHKSSLVCLGAKLKITWKVKFGKWWKQRRRGTVGRSKSLGTDPWRVCWGWGAVGLFLALCEVSSFQHRPKATKPGAPGLEAWAKLILRVSQQCKVD